MTDPHEFRQHFPVLRTKVHLASCSQGALSGELTAALAQFQQEMLEHPNPWERWSAEVERARAGFARLIGTEVANVAVLSCASEGAYQVASSFAWAAGDSIVSSAVEFPSVAHVWLAQRARGVAVRHALPGPGGWVDEGSFVEQLRPGTRLVSTPLIAYQHGQRLPARAIADRAHEHGARIFLDAYQGLGVESIDVTALDCDYLVAGTLKYCLGIPGIAFLYVRPGLGSDQAPQLTGWFGRANPFSFDPFQLDYAEDARRFQVGSPPVPAAYGAVAGFDLLQTVDPHRLSAHVARLTQVLHERLTEEGFDVASPAEPARRGPQVAIRVEDPRRLAGELELRGIVTSPRGAMLRLAVHYYTDDSDIEQLLDELCRLRDMT